MKQGTIILNSQIGRWLILVALFAALAALLTASVVRAQQDDSITIEYAENGEDAVAMFTAMDPEGSMVSWTLTETGTPDFMIDDDGMLKFISPPDFEAPAGGAADDSNTYSIEVNASDGTTPGTFDVTVMVTDVAEEGKVTWTVDPDGSGDLPANEPPAKPIMQFQPGATLVATLTDGDTSDANTLSITAWQWYRSSSKTSTGTAIGGANSATYTVQADADNNDVGKYLHAKVFYNIGTDPEESASRVSDYKVQAKRANNSVPEFASTTVIRQVDEGKKGMAVGAPVTATDADRDVLNYTLGTDGDNAKFEIDQKTGQIKTMVDLDFEAAAGEDDNCVAQNSCVVQVTATDSAGIATATAATVTIHIVNVDEKPDFDTGNTMVTVNEGVTDLDGDNDDTADDFTGENVYAATDPEGKTVALSLMGNDKDMFRLNASNVLVFRMAPDYENPMDKNKDNTYEVTVRASDGKMYMDRMVTVTVQNVDEAPKVMEGGLSISGSSSEDFSETGTDAVAMFTARGPMKDMAMWTLEGADATYFRVGTARGAMTELMFRSAPNYEMPRGRAMSDTNTNSYMVTLKANDGTYMDTHDVTVMVTNMEEMGTVTLMPMTPVVDTAVTATLTDPDMVVSVDWQWSRSMTMDGTFMDIGGATMMSYTPVEADDGYYLRATATYTDGYDRGNEQTATTTSAVVSNSAPMFAAATATRMIAENSAAGDNVGDPVMATDADTDDTLTYELSGDDAMYFTVDSMGQIKVGANTMLDYETKMSYMVTVTATDDSGAANNSDSIDVTIMVNNVDEAGTLMLSSMKPVVGMMLTATLTDPDMVVSVDWQWSRSMTLDGTFTHIDEETSSYTPTDADMGYYLQVAVTYNDGHGQDKMETATTGMVLDPLTARFDTNENGRIDREEAIDVLSRYLAGEAGISREDAIGVLLLYLSN